VLAFDDTSDKMLLTHVKYVNPELVLHNDNIALFGCDGKYVWFAITPPEVSIIYSSYIALCKLIILFFFFLHLRLIYMT